jgi:DNA-binding CsgD family transcriptional regulator
MRQTTGLTLHSSVRQEAQPEAVRDSIVFIGSKRSFTGPALRTVASEIRDLDALQCDSLHECDLLASRQDVDVRCIVIDARICDAGFDACMNGLANLARQFGGRGLPGLAMAYWDAACPPVRTFAGMVENGSEHWPGPILGFLPMAQPLDIWLAVIRLLISGGSHIPAEVLKQPAASVQAKPEAAPAPRPATAVRPAVLAALTDRETEVLSLVASGLQNKQIAGELDLSEHTIKLHMHHIIAKLEVKNRTEAAMRYLSSREKRP